MTNIVKNYFRVLEVISSLNCELEYKSGVGRIQKMSDLEVIALSLTAEFMSIDSEILLSTNLILDIHKIAFGQLYDWAGKWKTTEVTVGQLIPPKPILVLQVMYQFIDNLNFKISIAKNRNEHIDCLVYAHYEFIKIHPFNNGNGRTGRILMNIVAMKFGYQPLELYFREGESRKFYMGAMKEADNGNYEILSQLIGEELVSF